MSVVLDELDRQHVDALVCCTVKMLETCIEELREFRRESLGRAVGKSTCRVKNDTGLCRVGNNKTERIELGELHVAVVVGIGTQHAANTRNSAVFLVWLSLLLTTQADRIEIILYSKLRAFTGDGDDDGHTCIETIFFICDVNGIVYKGAEKVALTKLHDTDGML